jgi:hypothetical protein
MKAKMKREREIAPIVYDDLIACNASCLFLFLFPLALPRNQGKERPQTARRINLPVQTEPFSSF